MKKLLLIALVLLPAGLCAMDAKKAAAAAAAKEQERQRDEKYRRENQNIQLEDQRREHMKTTASMLKCQLPW